MLTRQIKHSVNPTENSATFILDAMSRLATYLYPYEIPPTSQEVSEAAQHVKAYLEDDTAAS